jgi:uncharacterized membrane protein
LRIEVNLAHLHLFSNHVPVLGTFFGLLALAVGMARHNEDMKKTGFVVLVLAAIAAIPVWITGDPAGEAAKNLPGVTESLIDAHENAALFAFIALGVTAFLAIIGLVRSRGAKLLPQPLTMIVLVLAVVSGGLMARAANVGGQIRHTEIRGAFTTTDEIRAAEANSDKD